MDRIAMLKSFIARSPADPFPRYGLALALRDRGDIADAWTAFAELLEKFPDYVPTYLQAGGVLARLGRNAEARDVYRRGIAIADAHTRGELERALAELPASDGASDNTT